MSSTWFLQRETVLCLAVIYLSLPLKKIHVKKHPLRSVHSTVLQTKRFQKPQVEPRAKRKSQILGMLGPMCPLWLGEERAFWVARRHLASFQGGSELLNWSKSTQQQGCFLVGFLQQEKVPGSHYSGRRWQARRSQETSGSATPFLTRTLL